jgi:hypothetical protein
VRAIILLLFMLAPSTQSQTLALGLADTVQESVIHFPLALSGASQITVIQWTVTYKETVNVSFAPGEATTASSKTLACNSTSLSTTICIVGAMNNTILKNGVLANLSVTFPANFSGTAGIELSNVVASNSAGEAIVFGRILGTAPDTTNAPPRRSGVQRPPETGFTLRNINIQCGPDDQTTALQQIGDKLTCICNLSVPEGKGRLFNLSASREDLVKALPDQIWIVPGQSSFIFEVEMIADPEITGYSILFVRAKWNDEDYFGTIPLKPIPIGGVR